MTLQSSALTGTESGNCPYQRASCLRLPCLEVHAAKPVAFYETQQQQHEAAAADAGAVHDPAADAVESGSELAWAVHVL